MMSCNSPVGWVSTGGFGANSESTAATVVDAFNIPVCKAKDDMSSDLCATTYQTEGGVL